MTERNLILLGDSILDNAPYTHPEPDSTAHLRRLLPTWSIRRLAQDGAVMADVEQQLAQIGSRTDVAVLSVGGNDAVSHIGLLEDRQVSSAEILGHLLRIADDFEAAYEPVAHAARARTERLILCTIYEVRLEPRVYADLAKVPLAILNDRIVRIAARLGADVLELRSICTSDDDFVLQIEPSAQGATKIAGAIAEVVREDARPTHGRVFAPGDPLKASGRQGRLARASRGPS